jgi:DNA mismatch repair protein MutS
MAGKSTYIRQTAILVILAQMGSYIPAASASIGLVDKIFTRIGAHDDITRGQSTFMVEMSETAGILNNLSPRSLVILDEIGRGTSTFDGLSLAWAISEYLAQQKVRTLFATHFHELTALAEEYPGVKNYNVSVKEWNDEVVFLHKIVPGGTDDSYGIYVAKLAGIPVEVVKRSQKILTRLELNNNLQEKIRNRLPQDDQLSLFSSADETLLNDVKKELSSTNLDKITPLQALNKLQKLKEKLQNNG